MKVCKCIGVMENYNFVKEGEVYKYKISVYLPDYCEYSIYSYDGKNLIVQYLADELFNLCFEDLIESRKRKIKNLFDESL